MSRDAGSCYPTLMFVSELPVHQKHGLFSQAHFSVNLHSESLITERLD